MPPYTTINKSRGTSSSKTFEYSAQEPAFYQKCSFWCRAIPAILIIWYVYACMNNTDCPEYEVVKDFDIEVFFGKWYEMYRSKDGAKTEGECVTTEYLLRHDFYIRVENSW